MANTPCPILLNHFLTVLDSDTYRAIQENPFLRKEFAVTEERTTTRTDISYTGLYFYGDNTYFEFFDAARQPLGKLGDSALAFGVDQAGTLEPIETQLASEFSVGPVITRDFGGKQVPWFYMGVPKLFPDSGLRIWIMEYHPHFLAEWNPRPDAHESGVSRRQILTRYTDVLKDRPPNPYLKDVAALTLAVDDSTRGRLIDLCNVFGYRSRVQATGTVLEGPEIELHLVPQALQLRGLQEITLSVNRMPDRQTEFHFGARSVLRFDEDGLARWSF